MDNPIESKIPETAQSVWIDDNGDSHGLTLDAKAIYTFWHNLKKKDKQYRKLGQGKVCLAFKCTIKLDGDSQETPTFAIKKVIVKTHPRKTIDTLKNEAEIGADLRHPFVVKFYGVVAHKQSCMIVLEPCTGSFDQLMRKQRTTGENTPAAVICRVFHCLIGGLNYLHTRMPSVFHVDVNPSNLLYSADSTCFKITDFGVSAQKMSAELSGKSNPGSKHLYVPPEFATNPTNKICSAYDIWSAAMTVSEIAQGSHPICRAVKACKDYTDDQVIPLADQIDWILERCKESKPTDFIFGTDRNGIPEELFPTWQQMTVASSCCRIRYRGKEHVPGHDVPDQDVIEAHRRNCNYDGPESGLVDADVFKKYAGDTAMASANDEEIVKGFIERHMRKISPPTS